MSIALERRAAAGANSIQVSGFVAKMLQCRAIFAGEQRFPVVERRSEEDGLVDSDSSESIGKNSDLSGGEEDCEESEVQSSYKGPLDTMDALEECLPIKKGLSKFYDGISKSFTSLADVSSIASVKDLAKPENCYTRKRKNLLAQSNLMHKSRGHPPTDNGSGLLKRSANFSRSTLPIGSSIRCYENCNDGQHSYAFLSSRSSCLPPLHPHGRRPPSKESCLTPPQRNYPCRSFSLSDIQCTAATTIND
ncbi:hypothetical protein K2173_017461 [Erythroxylum novogranatense]|uniref:Uncharacterized protein n=1 Tax=Erythroxylum novogranatense TaxID=1862640 RepID=A0AAV8TKS6_9ROSI|nr:hypothetical protein K2173_017461 [Erythroxylum novogranatense]